MASREELIFRAKIAEQCERYEDSIELLKQLIQNYGSLQDENERNLLSVVFKNVVGPKRQSWREIPVILQTFSKQEEQNIAKEYSAKIEKEIEQVCRDALELFDKYLIPNSGPDVGAKIFYLKMKGDYLRYQAEVSSGENDLKELADSSENAYKEALQIASIDLPPTSVIRLGLVLNYSVFLYEIRHDAGKACELAKQAIDEAAAEIDVPADNFGDCSMVLDLLRDNLNLWAIEVGEDKVFG
ncbi:hypothetical protein CHS0354_012369 [Potamilus streckersoni]|uniref:14-3-3 domain-containing protein n=1 Tax=Potamilus streckersoni TaxID=2493646 RepID=A0AAE0SKM5_9BIVA|nr:hypothetical protein CHS0354_012369 [Potamilus streckersoni]